MSAETNGISAKDGVLGRRMRGRRPVGSGTLIMVGVIVLSLGVLGGGLLGHAAAPQVVSTPAPEHLYLTIAFNPYTGLDEYFPANFTVPANVAVTITVTNYDNGTNLVPESLAKVLGTVGGTETVTNATGSDASVTSVLPTQVAHTFTVMESPYQINVPIPAAEGTTPTVVTFTIVFTTAGQFTWHCMAPCDPAAMNTPGFMTGTVTVVSQ